MLAGLRGVSAEAAAAQRATSALGRCLVPTLLRLGQHREPIRRSVATSTESATPAATPETDGFDGMSGTSRSELAARAEAWTERQTTMLKVWVFFFFFFFFFSVWEVAALVGPGGAVQLRLIV